MTLPALVPKTEQWYKALLEEMRATWVELNFNLRWTLIERNHKLGELLRTTIKENAEVPMTELVKQVAEDIDCSEALLWQCIQFFDTYPNLDSLPGGKAVAWTQIRAGLSTKTIPQIDTFNAEKIAARFVKNYGEVKALKIATAIKQLCAKSQQES